MTTFAGGVLDCDSLYYTDHGRLRCFQRRVSRGAVNYATRFGQVIADYPTDSPLPSKLLLTFIEGRALHVLIGRDPQSRECLLITAYWPDPELWSADFTQKINRRQ